jgi:hypothetical protein
VCVFDQQARGGEAQRVGVQVTADEAPAELPAGRCCGSGSDERVDDERRRFAERRDRALDHSQRQRVVVAHAGAIGAAVLETQTSSG